MGSLQMATDGKQSPTWLLDSGERWYSSPVTRSPATRDLAAAHTGLGGRGLKEDALGVAPESSG